MNKSLRFCLVTTFYPPYHFGGDGVFVYRLAQALAAAGHKVDVIHSVDAYRLQHPAEPGAAFDDHPNLTLHSLESSRYRFSALSMHQLGSPAAHGGRLREIFADNTYDVIHYHNISLMGGPGVLRFGSAVKLYTTHEYWLICPTHILFTFDREACKERKCLRCTLHARRPPQLWRYTDWIRRCTAYVDTFIVPSRFAMEQHRATGLDLPMVRIPHFIPEQNASAEVAPRERPYFLFVGRLEKYKGVQDLIPLFANYREATLLIAGAGDYGEVLRAQARSLPNVEFLGQLHPAELGGLYRQALAVLVPSLCYEVFSLIPLEAFAQGTPIIARRIGALEEVVRESGGGLLFTTPTECLEAMEAIRTQPGLRAELGEKGRRMVLSDWTLEAHLAKYMKLVQRTLAEKTSR